MSDFISLICPLCGGKLRALPTATTLRCEFCGVDHLIRSEASARSLIPKLRATIGIKGIGGITVPLLVQGTLLPVEIVRSFSTTEDRQTQISIILAYGDNQAFADNIELGKFTYVIKPRLRGKPRVDIKIEVNEIMVMRVYATDTDSEHTELLGEVNIARREPPSIKVRLSRDAEEAMLDHLNSLLRLEKKAKSKREWWEFWKPKI